MPGARRSATPGVAVVRRSATHGVAEVHRSATHGVAVVRPWCARGVQVNGGEWEVIPQVTAMAVGNGQFFGGGMHIAPLADPSSPDFHVSARPPPVPDSESESERAAPPPPPTNAACVCCVVLWQVIMLYVSAAHKILCDSPWPQHPL